LFLVVFTTGSLLKKTYNSCAAELWDRRNHSFLPSAIERFFDQQRGQETFGPKIDEVMELLLCTAVSHFLFQAQFYEGALL
jgi:hypothetical protein